MSKYRRLGERAGYARGLQQARQDNLYDAQIQRQEQQRQDLLKERENQLKENKRRFDIQQNANTERLNENKRHYEDEMAWKKDESDYQRKRQTKIDAQNEAKRNEDAFNKDVDNHLLIIDTPENRQKLKDQGTIETLRKIWDNVDRSPEEYGKIYGIKGTPTKKITHDKKTGSTTFHYPDGKTVTYTKAQQFAALKLGKRMDDEARAAKLEEKKAKIAARKEYIKDRNSKYNVGAHENKLKQLGYDTDELYELSKPDKDGNSYTTNKANRVSVQFHGRVQELRKQFPDASDDEIVAQAAKEVGLKNIDESLAEAENAVANHPEANDWFYSSEYKDLIARRDELRRRKAEFDRARGGGINQRSNANHGSTPTYSPEIMKKAANMAIQELGKDTDRALLRKRMQEIAAGL